ncbi:MAG: thiol-disulfide isomerase/thioredoxin [Pseudohongiellaceae bacterium]|jgi:thiol-disulfide isomerase/thioredoxin
MVKIVFYTTLGCHLCEEAQQQLRQLVTVQVVEVEAVDISISEDLVTLYGTRIPVLKNLKSGQELDWPFDYAKLLQFAGFTD